MADVYSLIGNIRSLSITNSANKDNKIYILTVSGKNGETVNVRDNGDQYLNVWRNEDRAILCSAKELIITVHEDDYHILINARLKNALLKFEVEISPCPQADDSEDKDNGEGEQNRPDQLIADLIRIEFPPHVGK